ncbi:MAG: class I SAM-dependent methyltransferase [Pseudonocardiaceae bacterium]
MDDDALDHYAQDAPVEVVRRGYDALSWRYRADNAEVEPYKPWIAALLDALDPGSQVVDLGCGCDIPVARDLTAAGHRVTGVDVSDVQIRRARQLVPAATFIRADATTVQLPSESYDAAVALYSLIHVPLSAQPALLRTISAWLVVDGLLLLSAGWDAWTGSETGWLGGDATMWWSHADVATYRRWLCEAGFQVVAEDFVPEGNTGHSLFWARRAAPPPVTRSANPRSDPYP